MTTYVGDICDMCIHGNHEAAHPCCDAFPDGIPYKHLESANRGEGIICSNGIGFDPDEELVKLYMRPGSAGWNLATRRSEIVLGSARFT